MILSPPIPGLEGEGGGWATSVARQARAAVAVLRGELREATAWLAEAIDAADAADMFMLATAQRRQLGLLVGGEQGQQLVRCADVAARGEGVRNPPRFAALLAAMPHG